MHIGIRLGAAAAVLVLAGSAAATGRPAAARKAEGVLVFGMQQDVNGFNTALSCCSRYWAAVTGNAPEARGAYVVTNTLARVPDLVTKAVATARTLTYTIRPDAYWYWGGRKLPVTYRDFVYTWKAFVDRANDVVSRSGYDQITGYTHTGDKVVTFRWRKPYADYRDLFGVVYPSAALAGTSFDEAWTSCVCGSDGKPVSDGPFYMSSYTKGEGLTLKANPYWYGPGPGLREVDFKLVTDTNAEIDALRSGEVDAIAPSPDAALSSLEHQAGIAYSAVPSLYQEHVDIQLGPTAGNALLRAPWMRQALMLGMDRGAVVKALFGDVAPGLRPLDSLLYYQADRADYRPDFGRWSYDPARALALLKAHCSGGPSTPTPGNTKIWACSGLPARFRWTISGDRRRETSFTMLRSQLASIGIELDGAPMPSDVAFGPTVLQAGNYDLFEFAWVTSPDPGAFVPIWSCRGASNYLGYCDRKVTSLLLASNGELNAAQRAADLRRADALLAADVPSIPLYATPSILVHAAAVAGMTNNPSAAGPAWDIENWRWKS